MNQPKPASGLWNRQFLLVLAQNSAFSAAFNGFVPILPLYLASFGASAEEVGVIVGSYGLAALVLRPLSGRLTDHFGPKAMTMVGALFFALSTPLMALSASTPVLIGLRVIQSGGLVCFFTASTTLGVATVSPGRIGTAMGILGVAGGIGAFVASPFAVQIADLIGWTATLILLSGLAVLSILLCLQIHVHQSAPETAPVERVATALVNMRAVVPALLFLGFTLTQGPILAFVPLFALERGLGNPGLFLAAMSVGNIASRSFIGVVADRYGRGKVILPGLVLACLAMPAIAASQSVAWFWASALLYGLANGMCFTGLIAFTLDRVSSEERGSAIATFQWGWDIGSSVSAALMGMLVSVVGYGGIFLLSAVFPGVSAMIFAMMRLLSRRAARQAVA